MKKTQVLLIVPPSSTFRQPEENLGMGYLAAYLNGKDITCAILDGFLGNISVGDIQKKIKELKPQIVGFSPYQDSLAAFAEIAGFLRREMPQTHIVLGGFLASFNAKWLGQSYPGLFDSIIFGEGEATMAELAGKIAGGLDWRDVAGLAFWKNGRLVRNAVRTKISDLDSLPFSERPTIVQTVRQKNPVHISASRGCYGNCSFCSINAFGKLNEGRNWRGRSMANVVREIAMLNKNYGVSYFKFVDDCFFPAKGKKERIEEFCRLLDENNLKIKFRLSCRVNDVEYGTFRLLRDHGLFSISLGVESAIARQLAEWHKGVAPEHGARALAICRKLGIIVQMGYIMLDRGSTLAELKRHRQFLQKHKEAVTKGIYSAVFAAEGTELAATYKENGGTMAKMGINFDYAFKSPDVAAIAAALKKWSKAHGFLYSWAIDALSAPKVLAPAGQKEIARFIGSLKIRELAVFGGLINLAENKKTGFIPGYIDKKIEESRLCLAENKQWLAGFYKRYGLPYRRGKNPYLAGSF